MADTHDIAALCAAIDAGDDSALPILADALEEVGDSRAAGLRLIGARSPLPSAKRYFWSLPRSDDSDPLKMSSHLTPWEWEAVCSRAHPPRDIYPPYRCERIFFATRSAAYMDLAVALCVQCPKPESTHAS